MGNQLRKSIQDIQLRMPTGEPDHATSSFSTGETAKKNVWLGALAVSAVPENCLRPRLCLDKFVCTHAE